MCGIVGAFGFENSKQIALEKINLIKNRGSKAAGYIDNNYLLYGEDPQQISNELSINNNLNKNKKQYKINFALTHILHPMVNFIKQPLSENGDFAFNGEIYNWVELSKKYELDVENDSMFLFKLFENLDDFNPNKISKILNEIDGVYSFVYFRDNKLILSRDLLGVKPMFYNIENNTIIVGSESKIFDENYTELEPGKTITIDLETFEIKEDKTSLNLPQLTNESYEEVETNLYELFKDAVKKRVPKDKKIGVLFSGGVDSTAIALMLKNLGIDFTCYSAKLLGGNIEEAQDLIYSKEIAQMYNLDLSISQIKVEGLDKTTTEVMEIIEDCDYIKTSVALPFYLATKQAQVDGVDVLFTGVGSEELFAGYRRHKHVDDINLECLKGLEIIHKRDLYRDDVITMSGNIEARIPFLDKKLVEYSLSIPPSYKLTKDKDISKLILRTMTQKYLNLEEKYANRKKKAAQYGSKFDKGLLRLAKNNDMKKQDYLNHLWDTTIDKKRPEKVWY